MDTFLTYLPEEITLKSGHQQTPDTLFLTYSGEDFIKILNHPISEKFRFRFLEEKEAPNLLIHLFFTNEYGNLHLTFQLDNLSDDFNSQLVEFFPSATLYLSDSE